MVEEKILMIKKQPIVVDTWMIVFELFMMLDQVKICQWASMPINAKDIEQYCWTWEKKK